MESKPGMTFVDWELRPAVLIKPGKAYAVLRPGSPWVEVSFAEVGDSGRLLNETHFRKMFENDDDGPLPPLPGEAATASS